MTAEESKDLRKYSNPDLETAKVFASRHHSIARLLPFSLAEIEAEIASRAPKPVAVAVAPAEESPIAVAPVAEEEFTPEAESQTGEESSN